MRIDASSDVQGHTSLEWEDFISGALSDASFSFEEANFCNGFSCSPTAVTAINEALIARTVSAGEGGLVIAISDYQKEALAHCLNEAIAATKRAGESRVSPLPENTHRSDVLCFGDTVVEFKEITPDSESDDDRVWFICNGERTSLPLSRLPMLHHCANQDMPRKARVKEKKSFGTLAKDYRGRDKLERTMLDGCSSIPSAIGLAIPSSRVPNTTPTQFNKGIIRMAGKAMRIADILPSAHFSSKTELEVDYEYPADVTPAVVLSSRDVRNAGKGRLSDFLNYLDDGGVLSEVVVELDNALEIDDGYINDIIDIAKSYHVPVIIFCDLVTASSAVFERELRFPVFCWNTPEIKSVLGISKTIHSPLRFSAQQINFCSRFGSVMMGYTEPPEGVNDAACELFNLVDDSHALPEREQEALVDLLRLFGQMLRRTCACSKAISEKASVQLSAIQERLCGDNSSKSLSPSQEQAIVRICELLRRLTAQGFVPPKEEKVWERIDAMEGEPLYLVVSNAGTRDEERCYWNLGLQSSYTSSNNLVVLSLHDFMRTDLSGMAAYTILSGWFNREEIGRILMSGNSKYYYSLLYTGSNLESAWRQRAEKYWEKCEERETKASSTTLKRLGISRQTSNDSRRRGKWCECAPDTPSTLENLSEAFRIVSNRIDTTAHQGDEGVPARPVFFSNGDVCWLECSEARHARLITVTGCLAADGEPVRKPASLLEPGDVVLKIDNDDDLICDAGSHSNDYAIMLARARAWYKPIQDARANNGVLPRQAIKMIQSSGCKRGLQTIRKWITDDTCIAPEDDNDIRAIGMAFGTPFSDEDIKRMRAAEKYCLGKRIRKGKTVTNESIRLFIEEVRRANSFDAAELQFAKTYASQGELKVYYVDWVGDERVTTRRLGWHTE